MYTLICICTKQKHGVVQNRFIANSGLSTQIVLCRCIAKSSKFNGKHAFLVRPLLFTAFHSYSRTHREKFASKKNVERENEREREKE